MTRPAPHPPSQVSLDRIFERAARVLVHEEPTTPGRSFQEPLVELRDRSTLAALRGALQIQEAPDRWFHCMCIGEEMLELRDESDGVLACITLHHGLSIRWDAWTSDASLLDPMKLLVFLDSHGVSEPLLRFEADGRRRAEAIDQYRRWTLTMPECLKRFADSGDAIIAYANAMSIALGDAMPDSRDRALALFAWFGSGEGPWSGYPAYESVTERILLLEPTAGLVAALDEAPRLRDEHLMGAARYFGGWDFRCSRPDELAALPASLKRRLLAHVVKRGDEDRIARARKAFG